MIDPSSADRIKATAEEGVHVNLLQGSQIWHTHVPIRRYDISRSIDPSVIEVGSTKVGPNPLHGGVNTQ